MNLKEPHMTMAEDSTTPSTPLAATSRHRTLANNLVQSTLRAFSPTSLSGSMPVAPKDDQAVPSTPSRTSTLQRGLSLQLPKQDLTSPSASKLSHGIPPSSPRLDPSISFGASVIPRRSRGLDFSRACTNLHHSTLAESSPDSSPIVGHRGMPIPRRSGGTFDSPLASGSVWANNSERMLGSSIGSNAMETSDSSESDEDMMREEDEAIHMTPQPMRSVWGVGAAQSPGFDPMARTPTSRKFSNLAKRLRIKPRRRLPIAESPGNLSPPLTRNNGESNGYLADMSRRESLNLGTYQLNLSDEVPQDALGLSSEVIRRPVTRRSNMLPKPKGFARIRAALQEESSPLEIETKHEAAVIRHVRESDNSLETQSTAAPSTATSSPNLAPTTSNEAIDELTNIMSKARDSVSFGRHALRNSGGSEFWDGFNGHIRTPPPRFPKRTNSSISEFEDVSMDSTASHPSVEHPSQSPSRASTPQPLEMRKTLGKRRREEDFDPAAMKRRAVSPGLSHQNSPVLPPSPAMGNGQWPGWQAKIHRESSASSSGTPVGMSKRASRVGMQGMMDTSDGMMNMSIE